MVTTATDNLPLLFLFQNFQTLEIWENALTMADIRVVSEVQNEAKDQILQLEHDLKEPKDHRVIFHTM